MVTTLSERTPVARKDYPCMACYWLIDVWSEVKDSLLPEEMAAVKEAEANAYKIKAGQKYLYQYNVNFGEAFVFRAIPSIHDICVRLDLYPND